MCVCWWWKKVYFSYYESYQKISWKHKFANHCCKWCSPFVCFPNTRIFRLARRTHSGCYLYICNWSVVLHKIQETKRRLVRFLPKSLNVYSATIRRPQNEEHSYGSFATGAAAAAANFKLSNRCEHGPSRQTCLSSDAFSAGHQFKPFCKSHNFCKFLFSHLSVGDDTLCLTGL